MGSNPKEAESQGSRKPAPGQLSTAIEKKKKKTKKKKHSVSDVFCVLYVLYVFCGLWVVFSSCVCRLTMWLVLYVSRLLRLRRGPARIASDRLASETGIRIYNITVPTKGPTGCPKLAAGL